MTAERQSLRDARYRFGHWLIVTAWFVPFAVADRVGRFLIRRATGL